MGAPLPTPRAWGDTRLMTPVFGERNFFWAWYNMKLICVLYFHFVPNLDKVPLAKFFPERGGDKPSFQVESTIPCAALGQSLDDEHGTKGFWSPILPRDFCVVILVNTMSLCI